MIASNTGNLKRYSGSGKSVEQSEYPVSDENNAFQSRESLFITNETDQEGVQRTGG